MFNENVIELHKNSLLTLLEGSYEARLLNHYRDDDIDNILGMT
jgi:hypothetical protein